MNDSDQTFWHFFVNCMLIRMGKRTYCEVPLTTRDTLEAKRSP